MLQSRACISLSLFKGLPAFPPTSPTAHSSSLCALQPATCQEPQLRWGRPRLLRSAPAHSPCVTALSCARQLQEASHCGSQQGWVNKQWQCVTQGRGGTLLVQCASASAAAAGADEAPISQPVAGDLLPWHCCWHNMR